MATRIPGIFCLAASILATEALAANLTPGSPIRISIKNDYEASLDFGPLGRGSRKGIDTVEGVLEFQAGKYVGVVTAHVNSTQTLAGMLGVGSCTGTYDNSQQLQVTGHAEASFNTNVQTVTFTQVSSPSATTSIAHEYLLLEFAPVPGVELQPPNPNPDQDQVINCHTIIERGVDSPTPAPPDRFLPLNDSRWTMEGGGYIIAVPLFGTINYTDKTVDSPGGEQLGPFKAHKSEWTIEVERLP